MMNCKEILRNILNLPDRAEIYKEETTYADNTWNKYYAFYYKGDTLYGAVSGEDLEDTRKLIQEYKDCHESNSYYSEFIHNLIKDIKDSESFVLIDTINLNQ